MKFRSAHKTTTYATAMSSYLAVASSGLLNPALLLLSFLAIIGSWFWEPPRVRYQRWNTAWTVLAILVFLYELLSVLAGAELLFAGANFLVFLLLVKLYNRRESKDYLHIYLLSFLMLTAGTVLNAEVTYGLFFLCFVISSTWALIIFQLRRELEDNFLLRHAAPNSPEHQRIARVMNSERIVGRKFFIGTGLVAFTVFASAIALFLLFPRIGFGFFFDKSRSGISMTGFSDGVELGGHGLIKKDSRIVMRVTIDEEYQGRKAGSLHWRGVAFDEYSKGKWGRSRKAPPTRHSVAVSGGTSTHELMYARKSESEFTRSARIRSGVRQDIYLEPIGYDVLFGASMPLAYEFQTKIKRNTRAGQNDELRRVHTAGIKYTVVSDPEPPSAAVLRAASEPLPAGYEVYLQLPDEIPECDNPQTPGSMDELDPECRIRDLARFITKDAKTNYDKARVLESWLSTQLGYTLEMESPGDMEPVEFFLFERKMGHCEYFSSAMSVMARAVGIPVRNVNGFLGGEWNEYDDYLAVRAGDAHSWVEVFFPGVGWVTFDPTPAGETDLLGRGDSILDRLRRIADTIRFKWFKWVIEYDLYAQLKLFRNLGRKFKGGVSNFVSKPLKNLKEWAKRHKGKAAGILGAIAAAIVLLSWRRRRKLEDEVLGARTRVRRSEVLPHYLAVLRLLARRGYRRQDSTTPREFAERMQSEEGLPCAEKLSELTELYYRSAFGNAGSSENERAKELRAAIASSLREHKVRKKQANTR